MQPWLSPGWMMVPERIDWSIIRSSSSSWKYRNVSGGARKWAEPSASTGTVPRMRLVSKLSQLTPGASIPWASQVALL